MNNFQKIAGAAESVRRIRAAKRLVKIAAGNVYGDAYRQAKSDISNFAAENPLQTGGYGALGGAALAALLTAIAGKRDKDGRKKYLRNILLGALGGGVVSGGLAEMHSRDKANEALAQFNRIRRTNRRARLDELLHGINPNFTPEGRMKAWKMEYDAARAADKASRNSWTTNDTSYADNMIRRMVTGGNVLNASTRLKGIADSARDLYEQSAIPLGLDGGGRQPADRNEVHVDVKRRPS